MYIYNIAKSVWGDKAMINDCGFKDEGHPICNDLKNENLHLG